MLREKKPVKEDAADAGICPACGSKANRLAAKYCLVCGKSLTEDFQPLDNIRSSYGLQQQILEPLEDRQVTERHSLFEENENTVADTAWACVVYSMVPYLGILFVPFGFILGIYGYYSSANEPETGGKSLAAVSVGLSGIILAIQVFLWWLLYIIPEIGIGS